MAKSVKKRIEEYINYHLTGDADCYGLILKKYVEENKLNNEEIFDLIYFYSITYNIPSAIVLFKDREKIRQSPRIYGEKNKDKILFQSDRKYIKLKDRFENCLEWWKNNLSFEAFKNHTIKNNKIILDNAIKYIQKWYYFGRFSTFLFLEGICSTMNLTIENCSIKWKEGDTATSGIMNVFGYDYQANYFDKHNKIAEGLDNNKLDSMLDYLKREIKNKGGDNNTTYIETSLCAYRKFYKGTRYNGFYLDRQLEEIEEVERKNPQYKDEIEKIKKYRKTLFNSKYLGELNNWNGIRKELKKSYIERGIII